MKIYLILFFSLMMLGCDEKATGEEVLLPSDLAFTVDVAANTRQASVNASAKNVNFYSIYFGDSPTEIPVKSTDGKAVHTYAADGTYTIKVQAHTTGADFISETKDVTISAGGSPSGGVSIPTEGYTTPTSYAGMNLVWQDEFNGTSLNAADWSSEIGGNGWGNSELEYYRANNTTFQDGCLIITAKKENFEGSDYTSSRIITKNKKVFQYGRVDIRAVLPKGQGIWPALWMLGNNIDSAPWPACGEIDIMEMIGGSGRENTIHGTAHWDNDGAGHAQYGNPKTLPSGTYADKFHVFSIVWNSTSIKWYMDDVKYNEIDITPDKLSEFKNEYFFVFNVAVGGNWPGNPDGSTTFPQHMIVDYIRVFQNQ
jgi:beta-glucanase (GH16 family)